MDPACSNIQGMGPKLRTLVHAAADAISCFEHGDVEASSCEQSGGSKPTHPSPDDANILASLRKGERIHGYSCFADGRWVSVEGFGGPETGVARGKSSV